MAGTKLNNNFLLAQKKPLDERLGTVLAVSDLSLIRYPYPNMRVYVEGTVNKWYEYKLSNGVYSWQGDGVLSINYRDLGDKPKINDVVIEGNMDLNDLGIQPKGTYLNTDALDDYYRKEETLSKYEIGDNFASNIELNKKVDKVTGSGLITADQVDKLNNSVDISTLNQAVETKVGKDINEYPLLDKDYEGMYFYSRSESESAKVYIPAFIEELKVEGKYATYKTLDGVQDGSNTQFKLRGTFVPQSAELYISGLIYPINIGFTIEGDTLVITGAPIPDKEDIVRLKAIYLT